MRNTHLGALGEEHPNTFESDAHGDISHSRTAEANNFSFGVITCMG